MLADREIEKLAARLIAGSRLLSEAEEVRRSYMPDTERREVVRQYRVANKAGNTRLAQELMEKLFSEIEYLIYDFANTYSSGVRSRRSGGAGYSEVHNEAEELKTIGTIAFIKAVDGNEETGTGFDPDGPGTFSGFIAKTVQGAMKNAHTREKTHFGLEKASLDAPRGDDSDVNLYNDVFADSSSPYDKMDDNEYQAFLKSEDMEAIAMALDDLFDNPRDLEMFKMYYGMNPEGERSTPTQIGEKFGVSKQRVDLRLKAMVKQIRGYLREGEED